MDIARLKEKPENIPAGMMEKDNTSFISITASFEVHHTLSIPSPICYLISQQKLSYQYFIESIQIFY